MWPTIKKKIAQTAVYDWDWTCDGGCGSGWRDHLLQIGSHIFPNRPKLWLQWGLRCSHHHQSELTMSSLSTFGAVEIVIKIQTFIENRGMY